MGSTQSRRIVRKLNTALSRTTKFFRRWHITINPAKTAAAFFPSDGKRRRLPSDPLVIDGEEINFEPTIKYLGVLLDTKLKFTKHIAAARARGLAACCSLQPIMCARSRLDRRNKLLLVKNVIRPIMTFAAPIWADASRSNIITLQRIQSRAIKTALGLPRRTSTAQIHNDTSIPLIEQFIADCRTKFQSSCESSDRPFLRKIADDWSTLAGGLR